MRPEAVICYSIGYISFQIVLKLNLKAGKKSKTIVTRYLSLELSGHMYVYIY